MRSWSGGRAAHLTRPRPGGLILPLPINRLAGVQGLLKVTDRLVVEVEVDGDVHPSTADGKAPVAVAVGDEHGRCRHAFRAACPGRVAGFCGS
ncbi:hypothetical protein [Rhodococcus sp. NPDC057529]|uniref:hypothetical protein n=1 Tax=Rhodococcus sp. NPDC057529 TaxID=3346158 RepID=UPI00366F3FCC